jgi:hypothetical protein
LGTGTWKKRAKTSLVMDRDGNCVGYSAMGSKKGSLKSGVQSHKSDRTLRSSEGTQSVKSKKLLSPEQKQAAVMSQMVVMYQKAQEVLMYRGEKDLLSQAKNELGDIFAEHDDWDQAAIAWNDCVDGITGVYKSVRTCQQFALTPAPETLTTFGLKKCLMAGVVFAKLSKYVYTSDLTTRLNATLASANMFSAVFACSISHPQVHSMFLPCSLNLP